MAHFCIFTSNCIQRPAILLTTRGALYCLGKESNDQVCTTIVVLCNETDTLPMARDEMIAIHSEVPHRRPLSPALFARSADSYQSVSSLCRCRKLFDLLVVRISSKQCPCLHHFASDVRPHFFNSLFSYFSMTRFTSD